MIAALWIIAACEVLRAGQNLVSIFLMRQDAAERARVYRSQIKTDRFFEDLATKEYEKMDGAAK